MKFITPNRFILIVAVKSVKETQTTESGIIVIDSTDNPAAMGIVIDIQTDKHNKTDPKESLKVGDILFFNIQNLSPIRLEPGKIHGLVYDEAVLGWVPSEDATGEVKFVGTLGGKVLEPRKPGANVYFGN